MPQAGENWTTDDEVRFVMQTGFREPPVGVKKSNRTRHEMLTKMFSANQRRSNWGKICSNTVMEVLKREIKKEEEKMGTMQ
jgi:hypothetical protein